MPTSRRGQGGRGGTAAACVLWRRAAACVLWRPTTGREVGLPSPKPQQRPTARPSPPAAAAPPPHLRCAVRVVSVEEVAQVDMLVGVHTGQAEPGGAGGDQMRVLGGEGDVRAGGGVPRWLEKWYGCTVGDSVHARSEGNDEQAEGGRGRQREGLSRVLTRGAHTAAYVCGAEHPGRVVWCGGTTRTRHTAQGWFAHTHG